MFGIYRSLLNSSRRGRFYQLTCEGATFDLIYVDGDHARDQVTIDSLLAWRCLRPGGIMIWDDNEAYLPDAANHDRPPPFDQRVHRHAAVSIIENTGQQRFVRKML